MSSVLTNVVSGCAVMLACGISAVYALALLAMAIRCHVNMGSGIWGCGISEVPIQNPYDPNPPAMLGGWVSLIRKWVYGEPRGRTMNDAFRIPLKHHLSYHSPFRRLPAVEPIWLSILRGIFVAIALLIIVVFGYHECVQLPLSELGTESRTRAAHKDLDGTTGSYTLEDALVLFVSREEYFTNVLS